MERTEKKKNERERKKQQESCINCIEPLVYKTLALSGSESMFPAMDAAISGSFAPVDLLILAAFYLQLIILIYGVFSGKLGVKNG